MKKNNSGLNRRLKANAQYIKYLDLVIGALRAGRIGIRDRGGLNLYLSLTGSPSESERFMRSLNDACCGTYFKGQDFNGAYSYTLLSALGSVGVTAPKPKEGL